MLPANPPLPPKLTLPTMYDLPSEDAEEPGLPDEFHDLQPQLLSRTIRLTNYSYERIFTGSDLNLYYDVRHTQWYKRPDWFLVLDVPRLYEEKDLRSSYVVWQEGVNPFVVVELLSPGTQKEDLGDYAELEPMFGERSTEDVSTMSLASESSNGQTLKQVPPRKWDVYERILRVPYYAVFSRYSNRLRGFKLEGGHYQEQTIDAENPRFWISELNLGLGVWQGEFEGIIRQWLRWYDSEGNWILTDTEQAVKEAERERQMKEQEQQKRLKLAEKLKALTPEQLGALGINLEELES
ncbi:MULTISPECIES: Uma2 family endonuclease [Nostocales]|nr:Uma2 family endonuclease [Tolypothrix bouteillei]